MSKILRKLQLSEFNIDLIWRYAVLFYGYKTWLPYPRSVERSHRDTLRNVTFRLIIHIKIHFNV